MSDVVQTYEMQEEQSNLNKVKEIAQQYKQEIQDQIEFKKADLTAGDPAFAVVAKMEIEEYQTKIDKVDDMMQSPFLAHMDVQANGKYEKLLIGKKPFTIKGETVILDWRSDVGKLYYSKQNNVKIKGYVYEILLKRAVLIEKGQLKSVSTLYDKTEKLDIPNDLLDPMLLELIRKNKASHQMTNIIVSMAEKQYEIVQLPIKQNFVVQGCAGSGKTMVMLHRLSYLAYNHPEEDFSRYYVLTPNENFNMQLDELSRELELDKINRITMEEFYADIINQRGKIDLKKVEGTEGQVPKLTATARRIQSEKMINKDLLQEIYSDEFFDTFVEEFKSYGTKGVEHIRSMGVFEIFQKYGKKIPDGKILDYATYTTMYQNVHTLGGGHSNVKKEIEGRKLKKEELGKQLILLREEKDDAKRELLECKDEMIGWLLGKKEKLEDTEKQLQEVQVREQKIAALVDEIQQETQQRQQVDERIRTLTNHIGQLKTAHDLNNCTEDFKDFLMKECSSELRMIEKFKADLSKVPFYNFGKKRTLSTTIKTIEGELQEIVDAALQSWIDNEQAKLQQLDEVIQKIQQEKTELEKELSHYKNEKHANLPEKELYEKCLATLQEKECPDLAGVITVKEKSMLEPVVSFYMDRYDIYRDKRKSVKKREHIIETLDGEIEDLQKKLLDEAEYHKLKKVRDMLKDYDMDALQTRMKNDLQKLYEKYGVELDINDTYRHQLYLKLLLCGLYYGPVQNQSYFINIDEAQDLAVSEYKALQMAVGEKSVYNLYGDVNQAIYEYKGIADWCDIPGITHDELMFLDANYRNTVEICEYGNKVFNADIKPIGIHGNMVVEQSLEESLAAVKAFFEKEIGSRVAVIYKMGQDAVREKIMQCLGNTAAVGEIGTAHINVITVEEAKGLEFDAVVVAENNMTYNEMYVAYTRALDNLFVVRG